MELIAPPRVASRQASPSHAEAEAQGLHRRIGAESVAKEAAKAEFSALVQAVQVHARQIGLVVSEGGSQPERVARAVNAFCSDVRERLREEPPMSADASGLALVEGARSYDVLRQTLSSTQRRCQSLNEDMLRVADANEELMSTMQAVKGTNKRLVEQIQSQSDEIARLTTHRLSDEDRFEHLLQLQQQELDGWRKEAEGHLSKAEAQSSEAHEEMRKRLAAKVDTVREKLQAMHADAKQLKAQQAESLAEAKILAGTGFRDGLHWLSAQLADCLAKQKQTNEATITRLEDDCHELRSKLGVEREARMREGGSWRARTTALEQEETELARKAEGELSRLKSDLEGVHRTRKAETAAGEQEMKHHQERLRDLVVQTRTMDAMLATAAAATSTLSARCKAREAEKARLEEQQQDAHQQIRDSDEALDRAVSSNEQLRREMEVQRSEAQAKCEVGLRERAEAFEAALARLQSQAQRDRSEVEKRVEDMDVASANLAGDVSRLRLEVERRNADRFASQRDATLWRAQDELATKLKAEVEHELKDAMTDWERQIQLLKNQQESSGERRARLEDELRRIKAAHSDFKKGADARKQLNASQVAILEEKVRDTEAALANAKRNLSEKVADHAAQQSELGVLRASTSEAKTTFEEQLSRVAADAAAMRERLTADAQAERQKSLAMVAEHNALREREEHELHQAHSRPQSRIATLEKEIAERHERYRSDQHHATLKREANQKQIESLEADLGEAQRLLDENEAQLAEETSSMKERHMSSASEFARLESERNAVREKLGRANENVKSLTLELEASQRHERSEKDSLSRELADLHKQSQATTRDGESRVEAQRKKQEAELHAAESRYRAEAEQQRVLLESTEAENSRLRAFIGEQRAPLRGVEDARRVMQSQVERMERRGDQLRQELRQSGMH